MMRLFFCAAVASLMIISTACTSGSGPDDVQEAEQSKTSAPMLQKLCIMDSGETSITLKRPSFLPEGGTPETVFAWIGINGEINGSAGEVNGSLQGPVDVSGMDYKFSGLRPDESYRIIVVASNSAGTDIKYINPVRAGLQEINPDNYPGMSGNETGHMKWAFNIAEDELDDFHRIESLNIMGIPLTGEMQLGFCSYRYAIAFTAYFLAVEQFHKLPACQEIIKPRFDRLIAKMINEKVWQYWANTSRGIPPFEPGFDSPYPSERDPVRIRNIMYSGHLAHMIALYEKLYGDMKWSEPGSIVFRWSDSEKYVYDNGKLQKVIYGQFMNLPDHCIECEPNLCFPECNQHPLLSLMLYDQTHGTAMYDDARQVLFDWFIREKLFDPETHETAGAFLVKQKLTVGGSRLDLGNPLSLITVPLSKTGMIKIVSAAADGWTGTFMHAWEPEFIEKLYFNDNDPTSSADDEGWKVNRLDESGLVRQDRIADQLSVPFFAMAAGEMGDIETRDRLVGWCEAQYEPVREPDGSYYYPAGPVDIAFRFLPGFSRFANSVTGELVAIAEANPANGMLKMHTLPFDGTNAAYPLVTGVDYPKVQLTRAIYDKERECLVISIEKGPNTSSRTTVLTVRRLDAERTWSLKVDGKEKLRFSDKGSISFEVPIDGMHDIVIAAE